jgi:AcrR family transcriptional regulator
VTVAEDTRTRVLHAAGKVFAERGFRAATVREICAAAGVNLASVNYYFGDKQQLYVETVRLAREMRAAQFPLPNYPPDATPEDRLRGFISTMLHRMIDNHESPWQTRLMMREIIQPTRACQNLVEEHFRPHFEILLEILDEMLPTETPLHVRQQIALSIVGQCLYYRVAGKVVSLLVGSESLEQYYSVEQLADHITRFSVAAIRHGTPIAPSSNCEISHNS